MDYTINYLSDKFYDKYSFDKYPEIERKNIRPYIVIILKYNDNTFAIPFRTNITHNVCYKFNESGRDTKYKTGIDYSKAVIVNDNTFIGEKANIDDKEYLELKKNFYKIRKKFLRYVDDYISLMHKEKKYVNEKNYKYSTLKYFHKELGIL